MGPNHNLLPRHQACSHAGLAKVCVRCACSCSLMHACASCNGRWGDHRLQSRLKVMLMCRDSEWALQLMINLTLNNQSKVVRFEQQYLSKHIDISKPDVKVCHCNRRSCSCTTSASKGSRLHERARMTANSVMHVCAVHNSNQRALRIGSK